MSLETHSKKRSRVYHRKFDHDEARRLRAEDPTRWTYQALADHFDVSYMGITRIFNERARARLDERSKEWIRKQRRPCSHPGCETLVWQHVPDRTGLCRVHSQARFGQENVRPDELRCTKCGEWKPDTEFPKGKSIVRRKRRTFCRPCATKARQEFRRNHPEQERETQIRYDREVRAERRGTVAEYVVLKESEDDPEAEDEVFYIVSREDAASGDHAIEKAAKLPGRYVAVPATRFDVVPVEPQQSLRVVRDK